MFESLFDISSTSITISDTLFMIGIAFISGLIISLTYMKTYPDGEYNSNFALTMVLLPLVVSLLIMLIGSDIAAAFSLAGAFSIIRFRSAPGEPKDIAFVLFSMMSGLAAAVGAAGYTIIFALILCVIMLFLNKIGYGSKKVKHQSLKITIPENLSYQEEFDEVFSKHNVEYKLVNVKNTSLGSLFQLTYRIKLKTNTSIPSLMDDLRARNSNLNIALNLIENTDY